MAYDRSAYPNQAFGVWRGSEFSYPKAGSGMGTNTQGVGRLSAGQGFAGLTGDWHPTVLYLLGLIVVEMIVFGFLGKILK